jgi:meso-butanediol dehydrogenase/(S,S)-butanediol dehydrogenase/diacetyl reductase
MSDRLAGKTIVVTGGGSGIGAGISRGFAAEGANVVIADLNLEAGQTVADGITASGGSAIATHVDITDRASVAAGIAGAVARFGRLDAYFNNAGMNSPMKFLEITEENFELIMRVNALGVLIGIQEAAKQFLAQGGGGKIVNTASIAGRTGFPSFAPYSAAKAAVISLTQSGARSLAANKITVNAFAPAKDILLGRPAQPEDIAPTAIFLASSDSDYITGQVIAIEGGMILV